MANIEEFRSRLIEFFDARKAELSVEFPEVSFGLGTLQPKMVYISAIFNNQPHDIPDLVELIVTIDEKSGLIDADVGWGDGCGSVEASFSEQPVPVNESILEKVYADLPRLVSVFKEALRRKHPPGWVIGVDKRE